MPTVITKDIQYTELNITDGHPYRKCNQAFDRFLKFDSG